MTTQSTSGLEADPIAVLRSGLSRHDYSCCAEIHSRALPCADEILSWFVTLAFPFTAMQYGPLLSLLESCRHHDRVDELIDVYQKQRFSLTEVVTGNELTCYGISW